MEGKGERRKVEGIIFDLDGTLVDSIEDISDAANLMLRSNGYGIHKVEDYLNWIGNGAARLIEAALPPGLSNDLLDKLVKEFKSNYRNNIHEKTRIYDGIPELLDFLNQSGLVLSILSNKPDELTREVVNWYLSGWTFNTVYGQREGIPRKPDPAAAIEISGLMDIEAEKILFVGDSKNDMVTARAGGFIPVGVSWGYGSGEGLLEGGAEFVIHQPDALKELIT